MYLVDRIPFYYFISQPLLRFNWYVRFFLLKKGLPIVAGLGKWLRRWDNNLAADVEGLNQRLFNYTDTKALISFPLEQDYVYLRHSGDFSANPPSSAVFSRGGNFYVDW
jgi:hypothetical protein